MACSPARCSMASAENGLTQGFERADRQLLDTEAVAGHLIPRDNMFAFLAGHRAEVFPDTAYSDESAVEHGRGFRKLVKWRTGCEGRIAYLKRRYGWDRTRMDGKHRTAIWCGHGIFAHNLVKIAILAS